VYLSALIYNRDVSMQYFDQKGVTLVLIQYLVQIRPFLKHDYELKLYVIGLAQILQCPSFSARDNFDEFLYKIIVEMVSVMIKLHDMSERKRKEEAKQEINLRDSDESDASDDDDDDSDEDEELDDSDGANEDHTEETKDEPN
jgi:ABC-type Zn2+ transport system substrate-binding protein/surface adhesin